VAASNRTSAQQRKACQVNLAQLLDEWGVRREFDKLLALGCDVNTFTVVLLTLDSFRTADSWKTLTGFNRRNLGTVLRRMEECASDIAKFNVSLIAKLLFASNAGRPDITAQLLALPEVLRRYAESINEVAHVKPLQPRAKIHTNHTRALLTDYVIDVTGQPHDNEVARLLSVVLDQPDLTADSQKDWRRKHRDLLQKVAPFAASLRQLRL
jgi:hypothetical protein